MDQSYVDRLLSDFWELHQAKNCGFELYKEKAFEIAKTLTISLGERRALDTVCKNLQIEIQGLRDELFQDTKVDSKAS